MVAIYYMQYITTLYILCTQNAMHIINWALWQKEHEHIFAIYYILYITCNICICYMLYAIVLIHWTWLFNSPRFVQYIIFNLLLVIYSKPIFYPIYLLNDLTWSFTTWCKHFITRSEISKCIVMYRAAPHWY